MSANIDKASGFIREAAEDGADLIALPENVALMAANADELFASSPKMEEHTALSAFKELAADLGTWILIGSLAVKAEKSEKLSNRSILLDDKGNIHARYDKIHLYDAKVTGGESHRESDRFVAGQKPVIAETPWARLGMTICYDLRFPYLYRNLAKSGAKIIAVPSSFTRFTGEAHWHVLLRARAIENGCYIIAPAQTGTHPANRATYGHSLIVDPWGRVLSDGGEEEGVSIAEIDLGLVDKVREQLPSLEHDRNLEN